MEQAVWCPHLVLDGRTGIALRSCGNTGLLPHDSSQGLLQALR